MQGTTDNNPPSAGMPVMFNPAQFQGGQSEGFQGGPAPTRSSGRLKPGQRRMYPKWGRPSDDNMYKLIFFTLTFKLHLIKRNSSSWEKNIDCRRIKMSSDQDMPSLWRQNVTQIAFSRRKLTFLLTIKCNKRVCYFFPSHWKT